MQYFLFDLSLTLAALLGYRAFEAVVRRGAPVASLARHAAANTRAHGSQPKIREHRRPLPVSPRRCRSRLPSRRGRAPSSTGSSTSGSRSGHPGGAPRLSAGRLTCLTRAPRGISMPHGRELSDTLRA